ncbi:MAG: hypothetical protein M3O36_15275 [Myxococcota bacterium]|nr:hypothetical protein [Myxococcota bacterium]
MPASTDALPVELPAVPAAPSPLVPPEEAPLPTATPLPPAAAVDPLEDMGMLPLEPQPMTMQSPIDAAATLRARNAVR